MTGSVQSSHGEYMIHDENTAHLNTVMDHIGPMRKQNKQNKHGAYMIHKHGHREIHTVQG